MLAPPGVVGVHTAIRLRVEVEAGCAGERPMRPLRRFREPGSSVTLTTVALARGKRRPGLVCGNQVVLPPLVAPAARRGR